MKPESSRIPPPHVPNGDRGLSRRQLLSAAATGGVLGAFSPGLLARAAGRPAVPQGNNQSFLVVVNLRGGNDGLNTIVPLQLAAYAARRPAIAIAPTAALSLATGPNPDTAYGLHPSLARLAALWALGEL